MKGLISLFLVTMLAGCGSIQSGRYVQIQAGDSYQSLASKYQTTAQKIKYANAGKVLRKGSWFFVPLQIGFMGDGKHRSDQNYVIAYKGQFIWPVPTSKKVTSGFGQRRGKQHDGIDIAAKRGTSIIAADDGKVIYSGSGISGYGNMTIIRHDEQYFTVYAHADKNLTSKGQKVSKGEVIARVGSTGRSSGPHLHFEIRKNKKRINPMQFYSFR